MEDVSHNAPKKPSHWGQAFELEPKEEVVELPVELIAGEQVVALGDTVSEEVKHTVPKVLPSVTPEVVVPDEDTLHLERLYTEGLALLALEDSSFKSYLKNLFKKEPDYLPVGKVVTKEGRELIVVADQHGEKFVRYDIFEKSVVPGKTSGMRSAYLPYNKIAPYLRK